MKCGPECKRGSPTPPMGTPGACANRFSGNARFKDGAWFKLRGGSWNHNPRNLRASNRNRNQPGNRHDNNGFRCVREAERRRGSAAVAGVSAITVAAGSASLYFRAALRTRPALGRVEHTTRPGLVVASRRGPAGVGVFAVAAVE
ncbi:MAG: SUMF1/EgtB/PvdO family nonheme iron enzyme [Acidobacteriota bacterium]